MGFSFWFKRAIKTIICMMFYYIALMMGSLLIYPQGVVSELTRGDKFLDSMNLSIIIVFIVCSVIVVVNRLLRKNTWYSPYSVIFSYFVFTAIHFSFLIGMSLVFPVNYTISAFIAVIFLVISYVLGKSIIKSDKCVVLEDGVVAF